MGGDPPPGLSRRVRRWTRTRCLLSCRAHKICPLRQRFRLACCRLMNWELVCAVYACVTDVESATR